MITIAVITGLIVILFIAFIFINLVRGHAIFLHLHQFDNIYEAVWAESDSKLTALKSALQVFKQCPRLKILSDEELEKVAFIVSKANNPKKIIDTIVMEMDSKETVQALRDEAFLQKMVNASIEEQMSEAIRQ